MTQEFPVHLNPSSLSFKIQVGCNLLQEVLHFQVHPNLLSELTLALLLTINCNPFPPLCHNYWGEPQGQRYNLIWVCVPRALHEAWHKETSQKTLNERTKVKIKKAMKPANYSLNSWLLSNLPHTILPFYLLLPFQSQIWLKFKVNNYYRLLMCTGTLSFLLNHLSLWLS